MVEILFIEYKVNREKIGKYLNTANIKKYQNKISKKYINTCKIICNRISTLKTTHLYNKCTQDPIIINNKQNAL